MAGRLDLRAELAVGRRALDLGRVREVTERLRDAPRRVPALIELLWDDDAGVAGRAADVLELVTRIPSPAMLRAVETYTEELIGLLPEARFMKLRWNLALTVPRLRLTVPECRRVAGVLRGWLGDRSSIVKTLALQGMADLTRQDPAGLPEVLDLLRVCGRSGTPAMRARSRILLKRMGVETGIRG
jgi:hypothetical protein